MAKQPKDKKMSIFGDWEYTRTNYLLFLIGIFIIVLAYIIMATGETSSFQSITIAPVMLVIGYLVIIPLAILYKPKNHAIDQNG